MGGIDVAVGATGVFVGVGGIGFAAGGTGVDVGMTVGVSVAVGVGVLVGVGRIGVADGGTGVAVGSFVAVTVGIGDGVIVGVTVGVGDGKEMIWVLETGDVVGGSDSCVQAMPKQTAETKIKDADGSNDFTDRSFLADWIQPFVRLVVGPLRRARLLRLRTRSGMRVGRALGLRLWRCSFAM